MRFALPALILAAIPQVFGAAIYVDNAATGANNGTSWTDAYTAPPTAAQIAPGDTVYLSGGTTGKVYSSTLTFVESGTPGNWITYRVGQDPGHNGQAIFPAISFESYRYIDLNGSRSNGFVPPTSVWNLDEIKGNLGIRTTRTNGLGIYLNAAAGADNRIRWVECGPHGTPDSIGIIHGLSFNNLTTISNLLVEYCWFHDIQDDAINQDSASQNPEYWNAIEIRWNIIERTGDDGVQWSRNGLSLHHNFMRDHWYPLYNGHPDQLQLAGRAMRYLAVYNNIMRNKANSLIIGEFFVEEGGLLGPLIIAGNLFYNTRDWVWNDIQAYGVTMDAWRENTNVSAVSAVWTNLHVLHNTVYYQKTTPFKIGRANPQGGTRSVWVLRLYGSVRNNLIIDGKRDAPTTFSVMSITGDGDYVPGVTNQVGYSVDDFPATHNIVAGANKTMTYHGLQGTNADVHGNGNSSTMPNVSTNDYRFALDPSDAVAKDAGYSLVALTNQFPFLARDLSGAPRGQGSGWDIGAMESVYEVPSNELVLYLRFDDDFSTGVARDSSPRQNHGKHFGYLNNQVESNRFPVSIGFTNPYTGEIRSAAFFQRIEDGWGIYGESGRYVGITNITDFQSASNLSFGAWVFYQPYSAKNATNFGIASNPRFVSSSYAYAGTWAVGLFGNAFSQVRVYNADGANSDIYLGFGPAQHRVSNSGNYQGYSTNWAHLGFTYDAAANVMIHYLNGLAVATNTSLNGVPLTVRGPSGGMTTGFLMFGGDNHNGRPNLTPEDDFGDQYPNHAWFTGGLADASIHRRTLTPQEMYALPRAVRIQGSGGSSGGGGGDVGGGGGGSGGSGGRHNIRATGKLSIGKLL